MRRLLILFSLFALPLQARTRVVLLHFSDYHSHAIPFYSEGSAGQGGIARAIGYLEREKRHGALVFSGGDMINKGSPAWSDEYGCAEWPWFNGVVSAMALGNHDVDYGLPAFEQCRSRIRYPVLSANTRGFRPYEVFMAAGARIGVFAVAGPGFPSLVNTPGLSFSDPVAAARQTVRALREVEHVDAVVLIGHESTAEDAALARAVPGIDLILGTHSHEKHPLQKINGTRTWFIAPSQYLTYISRVELTFRRHELRSVAGRLVRVDALLPANPVVERRVVSMQRALERDPRYAPLFAVIATRPEALGADELGQKAVEVMRAVTHADAALSTASSFRQALPPGRITMEDLRAAMPYDNEIVVAEMSGSRLLALISLSEAKRGTDDQAFLTGPASIESGRTYRVAVTDFMAGASGYRDFFRNGRKSGLRVREEVRKVLTAETADAARGPVGDAAALASVREALLAVGCGVRDDGRHMHAAGVLTQRSLTPVSHRERLRLMQRTGASAQTYPRRDISTPIREVISA